MKGHCNFLCSLTVLGAYFPPCFFLETLFEVGKVTETMERCEKIQKN